MSKISTVDKTVTTSTRGLLSSAHSSSPPLAYPTPAGYFVGGEAVPTAQGRYWTSARGDTFRLNDGHDPARDIVGLGAVEGAPSEPYRFVVDLAHVGPQGWNNTNVYLLLGNGRQGSTTLPDGLHGSTTTPWENALAVYSPDSFRTITADGNRWHTESFTVNFDPLQNRVVMAVDKDELRANGWRDGQPLCIQALTAKDNNSQVTDTDTAAPAGARPWSQGGRLDTAIPTDAPSRLAPVDPEDWRQGQVYFIMIDRFQQGKSGPKDDVVPGDLVHRQGGDLQGIIDRLDYLQARHASAILVTPPFLSDDYHGYGVVDFDAIDPNFGDLETFRRLVAEAGKRNIKVILDMPLNHVAKNSPLAQDPSKHDWFHHIGGIYDWDDPYRAENGELFGYPDLAQENPQCYKYLMEMTKRYVSTGIAGIRLDATRHISRDFWLKYCQELREIASPSFFTMGEVTRKDESLVASYQNLGVMTMYDYPLYFVMTDVFAKGHSCHELSDMLASESGQFEDPNVLGACLDNHDVSRFLSQAGEGGMDKLKCALGFLMTVNRLPIVTYGTESGLEGRQGSEQEGFYPWHRGMMDFERNPELRAYYDTLAQVRSTSPALRKGAFLEAWKDQSTYAFVRQYGQDVVWTALNNDGAAQHRTMPVPPGVLLENGDRLTDILTGREYAVKDAKVEFALAPHQAVVLRRAEK